VTLVLIDNDVLIKLAHWGLLDALIDTLETPWSNVACLSSLRFRARKADKKLFATAEIAGELERRLLLCQEPPLPDPDVFRLIQDVPGIDAGEVALFAACAAHADARLITGDKRSLIALATPALASVVQRLQGRIICLEQCLEAIARHQGFALVIAGILPYRTLDTAIRCIVGDHGTLEETFYEGLASYISHLREQTGPLIR
jgi:hypothetical protein